MNILFIMMFSIISCSKEKEYVFKVLNNTNYTLTEVAIDWCHGSNKISLKPNESKHVALIYDNGVINFFGRGSLCVSVDSYSDSVSNYSNTYGVSLFRDKLNSKGDNNVIITDNGNAPGGDIFIIDINDI